MGISSSNGRRCNYFHNPHLPPPFYYSAESPPLPPPPHGYYFSSSTPYSLQSNNYVPPPPQTHVFCYSNAYSNCSNYSNSMVFRLQYPPSYYVNHANGWSAIYPSDGSVVSPPPYVHHRAAKKIRNDVNVNKDTLQLEVDEHYPDQRLVSFVFDALHDGSITIIYFAKEEGKCRFVPLFPSVFEPIRIPFQKGIGQKFCQPSGTGIDKGFFELDDLSKPSLGDDVFPLVICAETCLITSADENPANSMLDFSPPMQITQAIVEKGDGNGPLQVKVDRQILWIDGIRYELRELYGIGSSGAADFDDSDSGKECVICMTEPKDTAVLPCRHLCMCSDCAQALWLQSNKCPICRQSIEELIEIKINNGDCRDLRW